MCYSVFGSILALSFSLLTPPLIQGGFFSGVIMNDALQKGNIGEHICAICLLEMGIDCTIVNLGATDILAHVGDKLIRIQVKGSHYKYRNDIKNGSAFYRFSTAIGKNKKRLTKHDCDIIALVALDLRKIIFCLPNLTANTKRAKSHYLAPNVEKVTWDSCIKQIG